MHGLAEGLVLTGCTNTSMLAYAAASSAPYSAPVKTICRKPGLQRGRPCPPRSPPDVVAPGQHRKPSTCFSGASARRTDDRPARR